MPENINIGPDAQVNHALGRLRDATQSGEMRSHVPLEHGIFLRCNPDIEVRGHYVSLRDQMFELNVNALAESAWMALHLELPARDLTQSGFVGLTCRCASPVPQIIQPCLRTGTADGFVDCFFDEHILSRAEAHNHCGGVAIQGHARIPPQAPWREMLLFFPTQNFAWSLLDLRIFVV